MRYKRISFTGDHHELQCSTRCFRPGREHNLPIRCFPLQEGALKRVVEGEDRHAVKVRTSLRRSPTSRDAGEGARSAIVQAELRRSSRVAHPGILDSPGRYYGSSAEQPVRQLTLSTPAHQRQRGKGPGPRSRAIRASAWAQPRLRRATRGGADSGLTKSAARTLQVVRHAAEMRRSLSAPAPHANEHPAPAKTRRSPRTRAPLARRAAAAHRPDNRRDRPS